VNFAKSSKLFVLIGIVALYGLGAGRSNDVGLVAVFSIGLGVLLGILSLFGVGRPAGQPYKAPWISLALGCSLLLVVAIGYLSATVRGRTPLVDQVNGFRLDYPGEGWKILSQEKLRSMNERAVAGANRGPDVGGFVFVETCDPDFSVAGREREVGEQMIAEIEVDDKRVVFNRPDELDGQKAVRCQVVGKIAGRGVRYEGVALIANGRLYRLLALGPSDRTSDDGVAFQPFIAAFHLLPTEPQAAPPVAAAPAARE
jgi:hypothetical protein